MKSRRHEPRSAQDRPPPHGLRDLGPSGAAALLEKAARLGRSGLVELEIEGDAEARLLVRNGQVVAASSGPLRGLDAALRLFLWSATRYRWKPLDAGAVMADGAEVVGADTPTLITEGLRRRAVWLIMLRDLPALSRRFAVDFGALAARLVDLPASAHDLCRLFDGRRTLGQVLRDAAVPELEAASMAGHLIAASVLIEAAPTPVSVEDPPTRDLGPDEIPAIGSRDAAEATDLIATGPLTRRRTTRFAISGALLGALAAFALFALGHQPSPISADASPVAPPPVPAPVAVPRPVVSVQPPIPVTSDPGQKPRVASPAAASNQLALARAALERGQFARAGERARQALALDPKLAEAYAYLGFAETEAGRRREAMAAYRRYLTLAPQGRFAPDIRAIVQP